MSEEQTKTLDESSVTANAKPADPMPKSRVLMVVVWQGIQDLGGPTPFNSKPETIANKYEDWLRVVMLLHLQLNHLMHPLQQQTFSTKVM